jgi:hypothetical protein
MYDLSNIILSIIKKYMKNPSETKLEKIVFGMFDNMVKGVDKYVTKQGSTWLIFTEEKKWMLLGGTVTAGNGTETIASIEIGDVSEIEEAGGEPPLPPPPDGTFFWLAVAAKANVEDDVLLPGCNLQGVLIEDGRAVRDNRAPTVAEPSGRLYISLGEWMNGRFNPAGCGNIQISHCPGTLSYSRG